MYFDLSLAPEWIRQYKIQPGTNEPIDRTKLKYARSLGCFPLYFMNSRKLLMVVGFNWTVLYPIFSYYMYFLHEWRGISDLRFLVTVITMSLHLLLQSSSLLPPCPDGADHLCAGGGGHVLLLTLAAT